MSTCWADSVEIFDGKDSSAEDIQIFHISIITWNKNNRRFIEWKKRLCFHEDRAQFKLLKISFKAPSLGKFCGFDLPDDVMTSTLDGYIVFESDDDQEEKGTAQESI